MSIADWAGLIFALAVGAGLGWFFFGGLWLTLQRLPTSSQPALLAFGSLVIRIAITVYGFYWITAGDWRRLAMALAGFLFVRQAMIRRIRPQDAPRPPQEQAAGQGE